MFPGVSNSLVLELTYLPGQGISDFNSDGQRAWLRKDWSVHSSFYCNQNLRTLAFCPGYLLSLALIPWTLNVLPFLCMPEEHPKHALFHIFFFIAIYNIAVMSDLSHRKDWNFFFCTLNILMSLTVHHYSLQATILPISISNCCTACELWHLVKSLIYL